MSLGRSLVLLGILLLVAAIYAVAIRQRIREAREHATIMLDDRYWTCTKTQVVPMGMAMRVECTQYTRK